MMENNNPQERHSKKIDLLAKCIEAGAITFAEALMILDADLAGDTESKPAVTDYSLSKPWFGITPPPPNYNLHHQIGTSGEAITAGILVGNTSTTVMPQASTYTTSIPGQKTGKKQK